MTGSGDGEAVGVGEHPPRRPDLAVMREYVVTVPHGSGAGGAYTLPAVSQRPRRPCVRCAALRDALANAVRAGDAAAEARAARERAGHWRRDHRRVHA
ncbi:MULTISPECIES: hypothetical protein [Streptomyces]|uniref:hypothetical protein n=1 Tax=Streptomyces TaxID=1883 RepID=UPI00163C773A|nr:MULTISPECIES: hypothetical protein [Streptomyces]MBC2874535.1 hypothetical protein [Streptomyces sp. TYQ1024]UBI36695.1 hypothetical protein K7I03_09610 [Streptomyces mobaraensis]UKW29287.1 hypothetical protein MCU78_09585 [Streptomyces sp. TYQ1024]